MDTLEWALLGGAILVGAYLIYTTKPPVSTGQVPANLVLTAPLTNLKTNQSVTISATLTDSTGKIIPAYPVTFQNIAATTASLGTVNTNASGVASLNIYFTTAGTYNVDATAI